MCGGANHLGFVGRESFNNDVAEWIGSLHVNDGHVWTERRHQYDRLPVIPRVVNHNGLLRSCSVLRLQEIGSEEAAGGHERHAHLTSQEASHHGQMAVILHFQGAGLNRPPPAEDRPESFQVARTTFAAPDQPCRNQLVHGNGEIASDHREATDPLADDLVGEGHGTAPDVLPAHAQDSPRGDKVCHSLRGGHDLPGDLGSSIRHSRHSAESAVQDLACSMPWSEL